MWNGKFYKLHGCGNDFIIIDNRDNVITQTQMQTLAPKLCRRSFGIGADGVIFLQKDNQLPYGWEFFNSDGSKAKMCINGARCAAYLSCKLNIAKAEHKFRTVENIVSAKVDLENKSVEICLENIGAAKFDILPNEFFCKAQSLVINLIETGVPHAVVFVVDAAKINVATLSQKIQTHKYFPDSVNVNFAQVIDKNNLKLRTFERGVNKETYACGSGVIAASILAKQMNLIHDKVTVTTSGGEKLQVIIHNSHTVFLTGGAELVYIGELF
jgi:diaminopimelate epimerase